MNPPSASKQAPLPPEKARTKYATHNRITGFRAIVLACVVCLSSSALSAAPFTLARSGKALAQIVLAQQATDRQKELAVELADYLQQISGAQFEIVVGDGTRGIVLGTLSQFPRPGWEQPLAIRGRDGLEAYGLHSEANRLLVLGATDLGLDRGITRLLETLGCRWFFPNKTWHIVPKLDHVVVDIDMTDRPAMLSRVIWWNWGPWDQQARTDHQQWMRRNWMGESLQVRCGHAWQTIIAQNKAIFDAHPEYLAWRPTIDPETGEVTGGTRGGNKLCISNPQVVELCKAYALRYFEQNPDADMVSMEPSDGGSHCECDKCAAMGPVPQRVHYLTNEVAKAVRKKYPDKYVGTYAYNLHSEPPNFKMEPNVYVQITAGFTRGRYTFLELIEAWAKRVSHLGIYEYLAVWAWGRDMPGRPRGSNLSYLAERISYYVAHHATTMSCESAANYGINGLGYVVASRLMWNPKADVQAICDDFYQKAFGPAAAPMKRYYERFDAGGKPLLSDHLLALQYRDVAEASALASNRPDVLARLDDVKLYLRYVQLMRDLEVSSVGQARLDALFPLLQLAYRTRHRYIVHSTGIRGRYATYYLHGIEQPENWDYRKMKGQPAWCTGDDFTHKEIEQLFLQGRHRFREQRFQERTFSDQLVHGGFAPHPDGGSALLRFQGPELFTLLSLHGEPLEFRLLTGVIKHYRDRRPTQWRVLDGHDAEIASGELPLDGQRHALEIAVPRAGTYRLRINDFGAGWQIEYDAGKPFVWSLEKGRRAYSLGNTQRLYFFVPKGTTTVAYHVIGSAHTVLDGDSNLVARIQRQPGNVVVLPVPEGQDGKPWLLKGLNRTHLWFFNCPNNVAAHAEDLCIPVECNKRRKVRGVGKIGQAETRNLPRATFNTTCHLMAHRDQDESRQHFPAHRERPAQVLLTSVCRSAEAEN